MPEYPYLEFLLAIGSWETGGEAYPDTGFEGGLAIPLGMAREILADPDTMPLRMADGTVRDVRLWRGTLELDGREFDVDVVALGHRFLVGREILDQLEVCFEFGKRIR